MPLFIERAEPLMFDQDKLFPMLGDRDWVTLPLHVYWS